MLLGRGGSKLDRSWRLCEGGREGGKRRRFGGDGKKIQGCDNWWRIGEDVMIDGRIMVEGR